MSGYSLTPHNAKSARTRGRVVRGGKQGVLTLLSCELNLRRNVGAHGKERGGSSIALALVPLATMYTLTRSLSNRLCYYLTLVHVVVLTSSNNIIIIVLSSSSYTQNTPITMGQSARQSPVLYRQTNHHAQVSHQSTSSRTAQR